MFTGTVAGAESSFAFAGALPRPAAATGNLNLFPKVNSLVVNSDKFTGLTDAHQEILRRAAAATRVGHRRGDRFTHGSDRILR